MKQACYATVLNMSLIIDSISALTVANPFWGDVRQINMNLYV